MKYAKCVIAYNKSGPIEIQARQDQDIRFNKNFDVYAGGIFAAVQTNTPEQNKARMLLEFITAVIRDNVPVDQVHKAFTGIDEYRAMLGIEAEVAKRGPKPKIEAQRNKRSKLRQKADSTKRQRVAVNEVRHKSAVLAPRTYQSQNLD
jgi:hypothetical protein